MVDLLWKHESLDERQLVRWSCYSLELQRCSLCQHEYINHSIVSVWSLRRVAMHKILCVMRGWQWAITQMGHVAPHRLCVVIYDHRHRKSTQWMFHRWLSYTAQGNAQHMRVQMVLYGLVN